MPTSEKHERREARIRGSGTRAIKVEELNIASPQTPKQSKVLDSLKSAFSKPEDSELPRLRESPRTVKTQPHTASANQTLRQEKRRTPFSSEDEDEDEDLHYTRKDVDAMDHEQYQQNNFDSDFDRAETEEPEIKQEPGTSAAEPKRRRGRPRKGEGESKAKVVTRRSSRIVANPSLRKRHISDKTAHSTAPKPLRAIGLAQLLAQPPAQEERPGTLSLSKSSSGKQRPLTIDAERLYTSSTRDRRFNLTTLDVLQQFIEEHTPRPASNDLINENVILTEFKAHLKFYMSLLMDIHSSIIDISHDVSEINRRKNDMRRAIIELKKKHAVVGQELSIERKAYLDNKNKHQDFMRMVGSFKDLKGSIHEVKPATNLSNKVISGLEEHHKLFHSQDGLAAQLNTINGGLEQILSERQ